MPKFNFYTSNFEFMPGEYLLGDIVICPSKFSIQDTNEYENENY